MKPKMILIAVLILGFTTGCHAHKPDKVVVVKQAGHCQKVVLIDNDHKRRDYRIVYTTPKKTAVCKKHRRHWHCVR